MSKVTQVEAPLEGALISAEDLTEGMCFCSHFHLGQRIKEPQVITKIEASVADNDKCLVVRLVGNWGDLILKPKDVIFVRNGVYYSLPIREKP